MRILLAEDEKALARAVAKIFEKNNDEIVAETKMCKMGVFSMRRDHYTHKHTISQGVVENLFKNRPARRIRGEEEKTPEKRCAGVPPFRHGFTVTPSPKGEATTCSFMPSFCILNS